MNSNYVALGISRSNTFLCVGIALKGLIGRSHVGAGNGLMWSITCLIFELSLLG